jgi:outer membrane receptor protein involved in Fe transport
VIKGIVTNNKGVPVENVRILVKETEFLTSTDETGQFTISVPYRLKILVFSKTGYETQEVILSDQELMVVMEEVKPLYDLPIEELMNLKITTASKKSETLKEIPASVVIVTRRDIERYGYTTLEEIFQNIPGFYMVNNMGFLGSSVGVRGYMTSEMTNLVVMVNGITQKNDIFNSFSFAQAPVPVESIDRIEVIRGPMSIIYGSNAFVGAINIITNELSQTDPFNTIVTAAYGSQHLQRATITSQGKQNGMEFSFSSSYYHKDGINEPFSRMNSQFVNNHLSYGIDSPTKTTKDYFPTTYKYFNASGTLRDFSMELSYASGIYGHTFATIFYHPTMMKSDFIRAQISYQKEISPLTTLKLKLGYARYNLYMGDNYYSLDPNGFGTEPDIYSFGEYFSEKIDAEATLHFSPNQNINFNLGLHGSSILDAGDKTDAPYNLGLKNLLNRSGGIDPNDNVNKFGIHLQTEIKLLQHLQAVAGIRAEHVESFNLILHRAAYYNEHEKFTGRFDDPGFTLVPRAALIFNLTNTQIVKLMYGEAIKHPDVWQLRNNLTVNKSLEKERIKTLEASYIGTLGKSTVVNASVFYNHLDNIIVRSIELNTSVTPPVYNSFFSNIGKLETIGTELSIRTDVTPKFNTRASVVYQHTKNLTTHLKTIEADFCPHILGYLKMTYEFPHRITLGLTANYVDEMNAQWEQAAKNPAEGDYSPRGRYGEKTPSYLLTNLSARIDNATNHSGHGNNGLYLQLKCNNLFNEEVRYPATSVSSWADKGVLGAPRSFIFSIGYKY